MSLISPVKNIHKEFVDRMMTGVDFDLGLLTIILK
jgi:hypothetical protein